MILKLPTKGSDRGAVSAAARSCRFSAQAGTCSEYSPVLMSKALSISRIRLLDQDHAVGDQPDVQIEAPQRSTGPHCREFGSEILRQGCLPRCVVAAHQAMDDQNLERSEAYLVRNQD